MSLEWLASLNKSISARVEGRNVTIALVVVFCIFAVNSLSSTYAQHPTLSSVLISAIVGLIILMAAAVFFLKPQPSEVRDKTLVIHQDLFVAGGMQSHRELIEIVREAQGIRDLPIPTAVVRGSATNESDYRPITAEEAAELVSRDREGVNKLLSQEMKRVLDSANRGKIQGVKAGDSAELLDGK